MGFAMGQHHDAALARAALCMAIAIRGGAVAGVVFHSDQGGEYTGRIFARACRGADVTQSMGRTGSALDNAVAESFYGAAPPASRGRYAIATATGLRPALDPGTSAAPHAQRHGQDQQPCSPEQRGAQPRGRKIHTNQVSTV
ncbi:DDE-type integrase/transposase/recombinase [Kibdelosporangium aridum]|uniref:DDE-type integrase/transposase/recombinase n=1 Tax=Kibdelosporangium aridum TaxID=2030 RepID=UPI0035EF3842